MVLLFKILVAMVAAQFDRRDPAQRRLARQALHDRMSPPISAFGATGELTHTMMRELVAQAIAASASSVLEFYFPRAARIQRYYAVSTVAEAAHATQASDVVFVNAGTAGSGTTVLATLTNDSDQAASATALAGVAWVAHKAKEIVTIARPSLAATSALNVMDSIAAGETIKATHTKVAGTTTGNMIAGIEFVWSS